MSQPRKKQVRSKPFSHNDWIAPHEQEFRCVQCHQYVSCAPSMAGVRNRNHCPACLWSRHLDWRTPGDRLSTCRAGMRPIGLTTKRGRNKYAQERDGELMIIHQCAGCEKVVINRIAGDDSIGAIDELFASSFAISSALRAELARSGVSILTDRDHDLVRRRLFGYGPVGMQIGATGAVE